MAYLLLSAVTSFLSLQTDLSLLRQVSLGPLLPSLLIYSDSKTGSLTHHQIRECSDDHGLLYYSFVEEDPSTSLSVNCSSGIHEEQVLIDSFPIMAVDAINYKLDIFPSSNEGGAISVEEASIPRVLCLDERAFVFIGSIFAVPDVPVSGGLKCEAIVELHGKMTFDMHIFAEWKSQGKHNNGISKTILEDVFSRIEDNKWVAVCPSLHDSLSAVSKSTFVTTNHQLRNDASTLQYWLSLCGEDTSTLVIHQRRQLRSQHSKHDSDDNECLVQRINDPSGTLSVNGSHRSEIICLEDVLSRILSNFSDGETPIVDYVSSIGVETFGNSISSAHVPADRQSSALELLGVVKAFQTVVSECHDCFRSNPVLVVRSAWSRLIRKVENGEIDDQVNIARVFSELQNSKSSSSLNSSLQKLSTLLFSLGKAKAHSKEETENVLKLTNLLLMQSQQYIQQQNNCEDSVFCKDSSAHKMLGHSVKSFVMDRAGHLQSSDLYKETLDTAMSFITGDLPVTQARSIAHLFRPGSNILESRFRLTNGTYEVHIGEMSAGLLIFVSSDEERYQAEEIIASWSKDCPLCSICISVVITVLDGELNYRSALLSTAEWIEHRSVYLDVAVALIGMEALLAFRPPGQLGSIIPVISLSNPVYFRLTNDIVFSSKVESSSADEDHCSQVVDIRAFGGVAFAVHAFIRRVLQSSFSFYSEDALVEHFRWNACHGAHPFQIGVDWHRDFFDFQNPSCPSLGSGGLISPSSSRSSCGHQRERECNAGFDLSDNKFTPNSVFVKRVQSFPLKRKLNKVEEDLMTGEYHSGFHKLISLYLSDPQSEVAIETSALFHKYARHLIFYHLSYRQKRGVIAMLQAALRDNYEQISHGVRDALYTTLAVFHHVLGSTSDSIDYFSKQLQPITYAKVRETRRRWYIQREVYSKHYSQKPYKVHFYTVASENKTNLQNLELTAKLAGVQLQVLGLGREYTSWLQKAEWYMESLLSEESYQEVANDDILLLMDAYDVLLTPFIRRVDKHLSLSPTPLLACAEYGQYPESEPPWFYPQGSSSPFDSTLPGGGASGGRMGGAARFMNSGCLLGRAGDVRDFLQTTFSEMSQIRDDQQVFVRHFLRRPDLLSVDVSASGSGSGTASTGRHQSQRRDAMFFCGWRVPLGVFTELAVTGAPRMYDEYLPLGLFHMNNRQSDPLYALIASMYRKLYDTCFSGPRGPLLLATLHHLIDSADLKSTAYFYEEMSRKYYYTHVNRAPDLTPNEVYCVKNILKGQGLNL